MDESSSAELLDPSEAVSTLPEMVLADAIVIHEHTLIVALIVLGIIALALLIWRWLPRGRG